QGLRVAVARHPAAIGEDCAKADILITEARAPRGCTRPMAVIDRWTLRREGTHAIYLEREGEGAARIARIETVMQQRGARPWSEPARAGSQRRFTPPAKPRAGKQPTALIGKR